MQSYASILETIGKTPVVPIRSVSVAGQAKIFAKLEAGNPSLSLKDRVALAVVTKLESEGKLGANSQIVLASNGNSAIAFAMVCAVKKVRCTIFMSRDVTKEKQILSEALGAKIFLVAQQDWQLVVQEARAFAAQDASSIYIDQFDCPEVVACHRHTTAQEILDDFPDGIDAFVMGIGTAGTITGVAQVLKKKFPRTLIVAVEPQQAAVLSGGAVSGSKIQQIGLGFVPKNLDRSLINEIVTVTDSEAYLMAKKLARDEGLLVGISSGANVCAALHVAHNLGINGKVLTVLCDQGQRYFSLESRFRDNPLTESQT